MRAWLIALRIARREMRRAKGRTALIVAMIGLPIAVLSFAAAVVDMSNLTPNEQVQRTMGTAAASAEWTPNHGGPDAGAPTSADLLALLPRGSVVTETWSARIAVRTAAGIGALNAQGIDATSPLTRGMVRVIAGRVPASVNEIAVSPAALKRLGARIGGTVTALDANQPYTVVGVAEVGGQHDQTMMFVPSAEPGAHTSGYRARWLIGQGTPVVGNEIGTLNAAGFTVTSRQLLLHPAYT
ncbi:MAG TPA: hypothetical protein VFR11_11265, partial [Micromonosporaceae bacterium]|nr:hypothetical protein [Micromonosporaceae bacterium]